MEGIQKNNQKTHRHIRVGGRELPLLFWRLITMDRQEAFRKGVISQKQWDDMCEEGAYYCVIAEAEVQDTQLYTLVTSTVTVEEATQIATFEMAHWCPEVHIDAKNEEISDDERKRNENADGDDFEEGNDVRERNMEDRRDPEGHKTNSD